MILCNLGHSDVNLYFTFRYKFYILYSAPELQCTKFFFLQCTKILHFGALDFYMPAQRAKHIMLWQWLCFFIGLQWIFFSQFSTNQPQKCKRKKCLSEFLSFTLMGVAVADLAQWIFLCTLYYWFARQAFFYLFWIFYFWGFQNICINIFDISSPRGCCNCPSSMIFCMYLV